MSSSKRTVVLVFGIGVVTLVSWMGIATAKSHPETRSEFAGDCGTRVRELESEVRRLQEQLRAMTERQNGTAPPNDVNSQPKPETANRPERNARGLTDRGASTDCIPPFGIDQEGNKYYFPNCLEPKATDSCSVPYSYDKSGTKSYKPGCLDKKPTAAACEPPYTFDANGFKSYKLECL
jgi:hypothetical protein